MKHKVVVNTKLKGHLEKLRKVNRKKRSRLIHHLHKHHRFSKETLFYIKEYGPKSHIAKTIIKESFKILIFASLISSFGGLALEEVKKLFITIIPLIIMMPALSDMIGDYGSIISSRFSTMLYEGKIKRNWHTNKDLKKLFSQIIMIAMIMATASALISLVISGFSDFSVTLITAIKIVFIALLDVGVLVTLLFLVAVVGGLYFYNKNEDPNNFLIPLATSTADFGNMIMLAFLTLLLF